MYSIANSHCFFWHYEIPVGNAIKDPNQTIAMYGFDMKVSLFMKLLQQVRWHVTLYNQMNP